MDLRPEVFDRVALGEPRLTVESRNHASSVSDLARDDKAFFGFDPALGPDVHSGLHRGASNEVGHD